MCTPTNNNSIKIHILSSSQSPSLCLSLQRSSHSHQCKCQRRFCCACWSTPTSSRTWNMTRRTSGQQSTTSSTGTSRWIISSSFCRCVDVPKELKNQDPEPGLTELQPKFNLSHLLKNVCYFRLRNLYLHVYIFPPKWIYNICEIHLSLLYLQILVFVLLDSVLNPHST